MHMEIDDETFGQLQRLITSINDIKDALFPPDGSGCSVDETVCKTIKNTGYDFCNEGCPFRTHSHPMGCILQMPELIAPRLQSKLDQIKQDEIKKKETLEKEIAEQKERKKNAGFLEIIDDIEV